MGDTRIEVEGLDELHARFRQWPQKYNRAVSLTMDAALLQVWESVPAYPPPPTGSTYQRTGTLGRTLGVGQGGSRGGKPDIYETKMGSGHITGTFGTNLNYAPEVIGSGTQKRHMSHWWTFDTIRKAARPKIKKSFETMRDTLVDFLNGRAGF